MCEICRYNKSFKTLLFLSCSFFPLAIDSASNIFRTPIKSKKGQAVAKYRHDENVLESQPTVYRQIVLTNSVKTEVTEYYTGCAGTCLELQSLHSILYFFIILLF